MLKAGLFAVIINAINPYAIPCFKVGERYGLMVLGTPILPGRAGILEVRLPGYR
jgi:hypothetical protein